MAFNLESWVTTKYVELYRSRRLHELRNEEPFSSAVLTDFLKPEALQRVLKHVGSLPLERSHRKGIAGYADWFWGAFSDLDYIRFFLDQEMRQFMNELMGEKLVLKPSAIPQFNCFKPGSRGTYSSASYQLANRCDSISRK